MLDIKFIREHSDLIAEASRKKQMDFDVAKLLKVDEKRRTLLLKVEEMRARQNEVSEKIASVEESDKVRLITETRISKEALRREEEELKKIEVLWRKLMCQVPNIPDPSVPEGESDKDNKEIKKWGEIPQFGFEPKSHIELAQSLHLVDFERGTKVAGFRGYFLKNDGALLAMALWHFVVDELAKKGFDPVLAPTMVKEDNLFFTGHFPAAVEDVYKTQDDLYLAGTAEIPMTGLYSNEILSESDLPKTCVAFSPCYRREAGSYGKDTKGLYRVHEFYKVEQFILCEADHEESVRWHEELLKNSEEILRALHIPYRVVVNCGGDIGQAHVKTYDIESWVPSENRYRETHSASYYHDFQSRRANIRYRDKSGNLKFVHTLNNTAIATPRILIALLENHQQQDGTVVIPEVLKKYIGKDVIS